MECLYYFVYHSTPSISFDHVSTNILSSFITAPIKPDEETDGILLMQPGNSKVSDNERQISVQLPLEKLLCNTRSGNLTRWGVIVSESSQATGTGFLQEFMSVGSGGFVVHLKNESLVSSFFPSVDELQLVCLKYVETEGSNPDGNY